MAYNTRYTGSRNLQAPRNPYGYSAPRMMSAKFAGTCVKCKQRFPEGTAIAYADGKASHATQAACDAAVAAKAVAPVAARPVAPTVSLTAMVALLTAAKSDKLKYPKMSLIAPFGGVVNVNLASERSSVPGAINVLLGEDWLGRVTPDGEVQGGKLARNAALIAFLTEVSSAPEKLAVAAKVYAQAMGVCGFCHKGLDDEGSIELGYGPKCAKNYGLPHKAKGRAKVVEVHVEYKTPAEIAAQFDRERAQDAADAAADAAEAGYARTWGTPVVCQNTLVRDMGEEEVSAEQDAYNRRQDALRAAADDPYGVGF